MQRDLSLLAEREFDVVIVGGGIFGICTAWEAASRGLSVALVERGDFAEGASANCFKIIHSGIRYLQHADISRLRDSSREQDVLLHIAPHQATPLPVVVPTYGHGIRGRLPLAAGMRLYDLLNSDRTRGRRDPPRRIPRGRLIGRQEALALFSHLPVRALTGAGIIYEAQMHSPARLALCFLHSAVEAGAVAANYTEAARFIHRQGRVLGVRVVDKLGGDAFELRGRITLNATGGWAPHVHHASFGGELPAPAHFSRDLCLVLDRSFHESHALAMLTKSRDPAAIVSRSGRHLFLVPWRGHSLLGVWHSVMRDQPDRTTVSESEVQACLDETNGACPGLGLHLDDVTRVQFGPVLIDQGGPTALRFGTRSILVDHQRHGVAGLLTLLGVRYTMARREAERAVDLIFRKLGRTRVPSLTMENPIFGGRIEDIGLYRRASIAAAPAGITAATVDDLVDRYGTGHQRVLEYAESSPDLARRIAETNVIGAEIAHAVRDEMAQTLSDLVFRRTELATAGDPGLEALRQAAACAARFLDWDDVRVEAEVKQVRDSLRTGGPRACTAG